MEVGLNAVDDSPADHSLTSKGGHIVYFIIKIIKRKKCEHTVYLSEGIFLKH